MLNPASPELGIGLYMWLGAISPHDPYDQDWTDAVYHLLYQPGHFFLHSMEKRVAEGDATLALKRKKTCV